MTLPLDGGRDKGALLDVEGEVVILFFVRNRLADLTVIALINHGIRE